MFLKGYRGRSWRFGAKSAIFGDIGLWVSQFWEKAIGVSRAPFETDWRIEGAVCGGQIGGFSAAIKETE